MLSRGRRRRRKRAAIGLLLAVSGTLCSGLTPASAAVFAPGKTTPWAKQGAWRREWDSNPRYARAYNGFRDRPVRPLRHPSAVRPATTCAQAIANAASASKIWLRRGAAAMLRGTGAAIQPVHRGAPAREPLPVRRPAIASTREHPRRSLDFAAAPSSYGAASRVKGKLGRALVGCLLRRRPARLCLLGRVRFAAQTMSSADGLLTSCANAERPQITLRATPVRAARGDDRLSSGVKQGS